MTSATSPPAPVRLLYLTNIRVPSEKAHVLQIFKNCEAFAGHGLEVDLLFPRRRRTEAMAGVADVFDYYDVENRFTLREIACPDLFKRVWPPRLRQLLFLVHSTLFAILVLRFLPREESTLFYTRDLSIATALALTGRPFFLELHTLPEREPGPRWVRMLGRRAEGVVVTTKGLASELTELGLPSDRLKVAPNAVDARKLDRHLDRHEAKEGLDLDRLQPVAAYVGHLYPWKGVDTLLACARELPEILFLLVGGTPNDIERVRGQVEQFALGNVRVEGHVAPSRVSEYLAAADVLLLPKLRTKSIVGKRFRAESFRVHGSEKADHRFRCALPAGNFPRRGQCPSRAR